MYVSCFYYECSKKWEKTPKSNQWLLFYANQAINAYLPRFGFQALQFTTSLDGNEVNVYCLYAKMLLTSGKCFVKRFRNLFLKKETFKKVLSSSKLPSTCKRENNETKSTNDQVTFTYSVRNALII